MKNKKIKIGAGILASIIGLGIYFDNQCFRAREEKVKMTSPKVKNEIRLTQISDFHSNVLKNLDEVLANIEEFDPDFIILTGDIIDYGTDKKIQRSLYFLEKLMKLDKKTYYISGNHEEGGPNFDVFLKEIEELGIVYLDNKGVNLGIKGNDIYLYGMTMFGSSFDNYKPGENSINIILNHFSKNVRDNYRSDIDFVFSGHTHGGQVRLPIIGGLLAPGEGFLPEFDKGIYKFNNSSIYIDSGLGNTFLPLRFLDQIQYSNITLAPVV